MLTAISSLILDLGFWILEQNKFGVRASDIVLGKALC
jgi:hypothetical protein